MPHDPTSFDTLFRGDPDPWKFKTRWYEARKRAVTLACLPQARYRAGYEPGCANGELSAALAERCDRLVVSDGSAEAVQLARQRLASLPHVEVRHAWVPGEWPSESFDLLVLSELGYFLEADPMAALAARARTLFDAGATVLACHWRRPPRQAGELTGDQVHAVLAAALHDAPVAAYLDDDFRIDVWCDDFRSVAQREGFA